MGNTRMESMIKHLRRLGLQKAANRLCATQQRPIKQSNSGPFGLLSLEIVHQIASFLPLSGAAALALCNRELAHILGRQYWESLKLENERHREERESFLQSLDRDLQDHLYCHRCLKLHLPSEGKAEWTYHLSRLLRRQCFDEDSMAGSHRIYHRSFRFEHVQMAMKMHRLGRSSINSPEYQTHGNLSYNRIHEMYLFDARVISNEMYICAQHWLFLPAICRFRLPERGFAVVCAHLDTTGSFSDDLKQLLRCRLSHLERGQKLGGCSCANLIQCHYCPTELQVDSEEYNHGVAVVVTKWMMVGAGVHPSDAKWQSHLEDRSATTTTKRRFYFEAGSIRAAFEQQADHFDFKSTLVQGHARHMRQTEVSRLRAVARDAHTRPTNQRKSARQRRLVIVDGDGSPLTECTMQ